MSTSFPRYALEQDFARHLAILAVFAGAYLVLFAGALLLLRGRLGMPVVRAVLVSTASALVVAVVGIALFEAAALWFRSESPGSSTLRLGDSYEDFVDTARATFFALYAALVLLAIGSGFAIGRWRARRGGVAAVATALATAGYLVVTLPFVDFLNACEVGRPFILDDVSC